MVPAACLALLLAGSPDADPADARAELDACAERIEELKARRRAGRAAERELERLLVRAQELALELERTRAALPAARERDAVERAEPPPPSPEELRERADAARDEADRLAAEIAELDVKLGDARRMARAESDPTMARAALGAGSAGDAAARVRELQLRRAALAHRRAAAEHAAARLEAAAQAADAER
jgi:DNA repair exonuclease SbcCD ATPase subunit